MRDLRQAGAVLGMAHKDFKALKGMMNREVFDEEIFGFHAQQTIEKSLKAWLALLGKEYPLTHDISALLDLLRDSGEEDRAILGPRGGTMSTLCSSGSISLELHDEPLDRDDCSSVNRKTAGRSFRECWTKPEELDETAYVEPSHSGNVHRHHFARMIGGHRPPYPFLHSPPILVPSF